MPSLPRERWKLYTDVMLIRLCAHAIVSRSLSLSKFPGNSTPTPLPQTVPQKSIQGKVIPTSGPLSSEYPDVAASVCPSPTQPPTLPLSNRGSRFEFQPKV